MDTPPLRTWAEISSGALIQNFLNIQALTGPAVTLVPVVKADAYGHGARQTAMLLEQAGARWFAVSNTTEGVELRQSGILSRILVLGDFLDEEKSALTEFNLTPALHSAAQITAWEEHCRLCQHPAPFHLDLDTGLSRLGAHDGQRLGSLLASLHYTRCEGLMTHLASAADFSSSQTTAQIDRFEAIRASLQSMGVSPPCLHMANSAALAYNLRRTWGTFVRPGLALYGYVSPASGPAPTPLLDLTPALTWKARILQIKDLPAGTLVGYNGSHRTSAPTRMAIVAAGYADGFRHAFSNRGKVIAGGCWAPVIGAVSMDVCAIDITACPPLERSASVTLLGKEGNLSIDARDLAETAGTVAHDILSGIGRRVRRLFLSPEAS